MANSSSDFDLAQLSPSQQEALQQYTQLTNQEAKDAIPLLERSQWNVQVSPFPLTYPTVLLCPPDLGIDSHNFRLQ